MRFLQIKLNTKLAIPRLSFKYSSIILLLVPFTYFLRFMVDWNFTVQSLIWFLVSFLPILYIFQHNKAVFNKLYIFYIVDILAMIGVILNGSHSVMYVGVLLATQWWGAYLYCKRKELKPLEFISTIVILYLLYEVSSSPKVLINSWQYGIILSELVRQNTVSLFLCEFLAYDLIYRYECSKKTNIVLFIIALATAVLCDGMGGILSVSVFFTGILLINRKKDKLEPWKIISLIVLIICIVGLLGQLRNVLDAITDDNGRFYIWSNYIACVDSFERFLIGADVSKNDFLITANNMHNTALNWHYCYGIIPAVFFAWRNLKGLIYCIKEKKHIYLIIMCVTLLRAFTDEAEFAFGGIWTYMWLMSEFKPSKPNTKA